MQKIIFGLHWVCTRRFLVCKKPVLVCTGFHNPPPPGVYHPNATNRYKPNRVVRSVCMEAAQCPPMWSAAEPGCPPSIPCRSGPHQAFLTVPPLPWRRLSVPPAQWRDGRRWPAGPSPPSRASAARSAPGTHLRCCRHGAATAGAEVCAAVDEAGRQVAAERSNVVDGKHGERKVVVTVVQDSSLQPLG